MKKWPGLAAQMPQCALAMGINDSADAMSDHGAQAEGIGQGSNRKRMSLTSTPHCFIQTRLGTQSNTYSFAMLGVLLKAARAGSNNPNKSIPSIAWLLPACGVLLVAWQHALASSTLHLICAPIMPRTQLSLLRR